MGHKRVLIADADTGVFEDFRQAANEQWVVAHAGNGNAALAELKTNPYDVVVADLDLPEVNGAELLNRVRKEYPQTVLFILGTDADKERVMTNVLGAHQFLTKPCHRATLKNAIERALALDVWIASPKMRELIARVRTFPTVPSLYLEVLSTLRSPSATTEQVGAIIAKDMAMMTKLLQVLNSAYFGLSRKITDPVEAVGILGFDAVKSMVMTLKLLSQYDQVKPVYFSVDCLWRHSTQVARRSKQLVLLATGDRGVAESAFTAGLMHDLGKIILASNFDEQYRGVQSLAAKQKLPLWEVEKEIFGAHHGEIGAYLLGLWGMPLDLLEASALHHQPAQNITKGFTALTAVHIANAWEHEQHPNKDGLVASKLDEAYLTDLGIWEKINTWRTAISQWDSGKPVPKALNRVKLSTAVANKTKSGTQIITTRVPKSAPAQPPKTIVPNVPAWYAYSLNKQRYNIAAAAAAVLFLTVVLTVFRPHVSESLASSPLQVRARSTPDSQPLPGQPTETALDTNQAMLAPKPAPPSAKVLPKELTFSDLKLQGVFFSAHQPSAIINGNLVHIHERIAGARVVDIGLSSVTLDYQNQRKTLTIK